MRKIILIFIFVILFSKPVLITDEFKSNILFDSTIKIFYKIPEEHIDTKIYYHQTKVVSVIKQRANIIPGNFTVEEN